MTRIYVVGGANIDIQGYSNKPLMFQDSNVGKVSYSYGGVARNIAENLALLNDDVCFVSAIGQDMFGSTMYQYSAPGLFQNGSDHRYNRQLPSPGFDPLYPGN